MALPNARFRRLLIACLAMALLLVTLTKRRFLRRRLHHARIQPLHEQLMPKKGLVMAKRRSDNVNWVTSLQPDWHPYIYTMSDPPEPGYLVPPSLRGRESVSYLTFIIEHYDALPAYTAFVHAARDQWHNDLLGAPTAHILQHLRLSTVDAHGFVNLRCTHEPGCPISVSPHAPGAADVRALFADIYMQLFDVPAGRVPEHVGGVCGGQFAVSRERIRARPRSDYVRMRRWAMEGNATDSFGVGWVFEKVWHLVFGMDAVHCPEFETCRCDLVGWCGGDEVPEELAPLVKGAHRWLGSWLGRRLGNDNAAADWT